MICLSLYLRCADCQERFMVNSDNLEEFKFWSMMARVDYANHVTMHNVEKIINNMRSNHESLLAISTP